MRRTERKAMRMAVFLDLLRRCGIGGAQSGGGGGVARGERADVPALGAPVRGGGRGRASGSPTRQGVGPASSTDRAEEVERLYRERYKGFTVKHFHEHLVRDHSFGWGYTWLKLHLRWAGLAPEAAERRASAQARAAAVAGHDAASGRLAARAWLEGQPALISLSRSMTRPGRSIRPSSSRRSTASRPSWR